MSGFDASKMDEDVPKSCQNYPSSVATNVPNGLPGILLKISSGFSHTVVSNSSLMPPASLSTLTLAHTNPNYTNYSCCLTARSSSLTLLLSDLFVATASSGEVEETALLFLSFTQQDTRKTPSVSKYKFLLVFGGKKARPHYAIIPVDSTQIPVRSRGSVAPLGLVVHNSQSQHGDS